ncbi:hypothetical protein LTR17_026190 [Elasticomyces elasticus]|nr:hypothetical protein LTR17_026190 [Elasticomyces elasticus]
MSLLVNGKFPPVSAFTSANVTADERSSAIDSVNRINYLFEEFNHDKMLSAFLDDSIVYHFHGKIEGKEETRRSFEDVYGYLIPGVTRHATNHIVDRDGEDGVMLFRNAWPAEVSDAAGAAEERTDGLPALWLFSPMIDRLRMTAEGWQVLMRTSLINSLTSTKEDFGTLCWREHIQQEAGPAEVTRDESCGASNVLVGDLGWFQFNITIDEKLPQS